LEVLESKLIRLRAPELSDVEVLYKWENDPTIWMVSNTLTPFSKYVLIKFIENAHQDIYETRQLRLMIDLRDEKCETCLPIGTVDLFDFEPHHQRAGIGILISESKNRQKGFATEALRLVINYAFNVLQIHQLYCNIDSENEASINLFSKHGFRIIGEKKDWIRTPAKWKNEMMMQLVNGNHQFFASQ
jgi:diamine N-acetyltransferase